MNRNKFQRLGSDDIKLIKKMTIEGKSLNKKSQSQQAAGYFLSIQLKESHQGAEY